MEMVTDERQAQLAFFSDRWLSRRPLAGTSKTGPKYRMPRARALTMPYVEANPLAMQSLIVTDHDGGMADFAASLVGLPDASWTALNPHTKSGHIVYALTAPVCLMDAARRPPVNLLARIEQGMCTVLGGDVAYGGRITKNPLHEDHLTLWGTLRPTYSLKALAGALDDLGALPHFNQKRVLLDSAIGRNVDLFETVRRWSYPRRGSYQNLTEWEEVVHAYAHDRNIVVIGNKFSKGPLDDNEVKHLARSISRWTWRKITRSLSQEQTIRGRNGGLKGGRKGGLTTGPTKATRLKAGSQAILEAAGVLDDKS